MMSHNLLSKIAVGVLAIAAAATGYGLLHPTLASGQTRRAPSVVPLPKPAFDSGWVVVPEPGTTAGSKQVLHPLGSKARTHGLITATCASNSTKAFVAPAHHHDAWWVVTDTKITLYRPNAGVSKCKYMRVRVWVHQ